VRRLAALDIIQIAGAGADSQKAAEKELNEMTADELLAFIQAGQQQLAQLHTTTIEGELVDSPLSQQPEAAPQQARTAD
jgi:hypothetical protein